MCQENCLLVYYIYTVYFTGKHLKLDLKSVLNINQACLSMMVMWKKVQKHRNTEKFNIHSTILFILTNKTMKTKN